MVSGGYSVPVILAKPTGEVSGHCQARPTHDGFAALCIPLGEDRYPVAVQIGAVARHLEIETIVAVPTCDYIQTCNGNNPREVPVAPMLDGVSEFAPGLWQCRNDYAFALLQPPAMEGVKDLLLVMVFRPVGRFA